MEEELNELEDEFIKSFIEIRKNKKLSQRAFAEPSGAIREQITKIEKKTNSPTLKSLIKILKPHGYTVKIEKIKKHKN